MLTGESSPTPCRDTPFRDTPLGIVVKQQFELAVRKAEFRGREAALGRVEPALPRVPVEYFDPGHYSDEDNWWSKQLGR